MSHSPQHIFQKTFTRYSVLAGLVLLFVFGLAASFFSQENTVTRINGEQYIANALGAVQGEDGTFTPRFSNCSYPGSAGTLNACSQGVFLFEEAGEYTFRADAAGPARVFVNGELIINSINNDALRQLRANVDMPAGQAIIRLESPDWTSESGLSLDWGPATDAAVLPVAPVLRQGDVTTSSVELRFQELDTVEAVAWELERDNEVIAAEAIGVRLPPNDQPEMPFDATRTAPGVVGQALSFQGNNDFIDHGVLASDIQTIALWVRPDRYRNSKVMDLDGSAVVRIDGGGRIVISGSPSRYVTYVDGVRGNQLSEGWHHVAFVYNDALDISNLQIGRDAADRYRGLLDDIRFYNRGLSANEIQALAQQEINQSLQNGLRAIWTFDEQRSSDPAPLGYLDSGLTPNTTYTYRLRFFNQTGTPSRFSEPLSITTQSSTATGCVMPGQVGVFNECLYQGINFDVLRDVRTTTRIDYQWGSGGFNVIGGDRFSVRWLGQVPFSETGTYRITARTDDGMRVFINNKLVLNSWKNQPPTTYTTDVVVEAGVHDVRVEYYEDRGGATAQLAISYVRSEQVDVEAPARPIVQEGMITSTTAEMQLSNLLDNVGVEEVVLYRDQVEIARRPVSGNSLAFTDRGLMPGTRYVYKAQSRDLAGNTSPLSTELQITTTEDAGLPVSTPPISRPDGPYRTLPAGVIQERFAESVVGQGIDETIIQAADNHVILLRSNMYIANLTIDCRDTSKSAFYYNNRNTPIENVYLENVKVINCGGRSNGGFYFKGNLKNLVMDNYQSYYSGVRRDFTESGSNGGAIWFELTEDSGNFWFRDIVIDHVTSNDKYFGYGLKIMAYPGEAGAKVSDVYVANMLCDVTNEWQKNLWNSSSPNFCVEYVNIAAVGEWEITNSYLDGAISVPLAVGNYGSRRTNRGLGALSMDTDLQSFHVHNNRMHTGVAWMFEMGVPVLFENNAWRAYDPPVQAFVGNPSRPDTDRQNRFSPSQGLFRLFGSYPVVIPQSIIRDNIIEFGDYGTCLVCSSKIHEAPIITGNYIDYLDYRVDRVQGTTIKENNSSEPARRDALFQNITAPSCDVDDFTSCVAQYGAN